MNKSKGDEIMKKTKIIALLLAVATILSLTACGSSASSQASAEASSAAASSAAEATSAAEAATTSTGTIQIAVPNDTTNEARALLLLEDLGYIKLKDGAGITATKADIEENPLNIDFVEVEAAQIPNVLQDVDYAIINSNYAIAADIDPMTQALAMEGSSSAYANIVACKEGNEETDKIKALVAALESQKVADYITETYSGSVVSTVDNPTDGFDSTVDYDALAGTTITVAASPAPHAEILQVAKDILAEKDITLDIQEYQDYVVPNTVVDTGEVDANYFQHLPYLEDFNAENGTHIVSVAAIHVEPMGLYGGKQTTLDALK
jgi:D-methionine transport system substrate-binding protein